MNYQLHLGDCLTVMQGMEPNSIDAIVTDPPAGIAFMNKSWDKDKGGRQQWIAWMTGIAAECLRVLKPGGHAFVWALPRTSHWTATAWEDAGFELRDCVYHIFGTGFPKSHSISVAIDKAAGAEREVVGTRPVAYPDSDCWGVPNSNSQGGKIFGASSKLPAGDGDVAGGTPITAPATDAAKQWDGWGTALKPAVECWWLLRKPLSEANIAANVLRWNCGALNIDASRIGHSDPEKRTERTSDKFSGRYNGGENGHYRDGDSLASASPAGRWPANLCLSEDAAALLDAQSGERKSGKIEPHHKRHVDSTLNAYGHYAEPSQTSYGDSGGAARFFKVVKHDADDNITGVTLCNEIANIAESLLTHDRQMSHGDSADFAAENAKPPTNLSLDIIGTISDQTKADGMSSGANLEAERFTQDDAPSGSGSNPTAHFQAAMKSIILTATKLMIVLATSNPYPSGNTKSYTARLEQIIESLTALSSDDANDATNTSRLQSSLSELLVLTTAIASRAASTHLQNGASKTESITTPTSGNITSANEPLRFAYHSKASKRDRDEGLEGMPERGNAEREGRNQYKNGTPLNGSGQLVNGDGQIKPKANFHPTVKPTDLMRWLVRLITPPGGTILDPFLGSGSTLKAAMLEGFNGVGIDTEAEYLAIADKRIAHAVTEYEKEQERAALQPRLWETP